MKIKLHVLTPQTEKLNMANAFLLKEPNILNFKKSICLLFLIILQDMHGFFNYVTVLPVFES